MDDFTKYLCDSIRATSRKMDRVRRLISKTEKEKFRQQYWIAQDFTMAQELSDYSQIMDTYLKFKNLEDNEELQKEILDYIYPKQEEKL